MVRISHIWPEIHEFREQAPDNAVGDDAEGHTAEELELVDRFIQEEIINPRNENQRKRNFEQEQYDKHES